MQTGDAGLHCPHYWAFRPAIGPPNIRSKLPENPANIKIAGQNDLLIGGSMKWFSAAILLFALVGCDRPSSKEARIQQVQREVVRGGGEAKILDESRIL